MNIRSIRFLKVSIIKIVFDINRKILKKLVFIKKVYIKLTVNRYITLN